MLPANKVRLMVASAFVALMGSIFFFYPRSVERKEDSLRAETSDKSRDANIRIAALTARLNEAEKDVSTLLQAIESSKSAELPSADPRIALERLTARMRATQTLWSQGKVNEAVADLKACYAAALKFPGGAGLLRIIQHRMGEFARSNSEAKAFLVDLRSNILQQMAATDREKGPAMIKLAGEFMSLNEDLGEDALTMQVYDSLSPDDPRKHALSNVLFDALATAGRYEEAMRAKPFSSMMQDVAFYSQVSGQTVRESLRQARLLSLAQNVDVLVANNKIDQAAMLLTELLEVERSESRIDILRKHFSKSPTADKLFSQATTKLR